MQFTYNLTHFILCESFVTLSSALTSSCRHILTQLLAIPPYLKQRFSILNHLSKLFIMTVSFTHFTYNLSFHILCVPSATLSSALTSAYMHTLTYLIAIPTRLTRFILNSGYATMNITRICSEFLAGIAVFCVLFLQDVFSLEAENKETDASISLLLLSLLSIAWFWTYLKHQKTVTVFGKQLSLFETANF